MLAIQYSFQLPSDYDMGIVERRVKERGHLFDSVRGLGFKAFLSARRDETATGSGPVNLYAPIYFWEQPTALADFLSGDMFAGVANAFGRPAVQTWSVLRAEAKDSLPTAKFASKTVLAVRRDQALGALRQTESDVVAQTLREGAVFSAAILDIRDWQLTRFAMWAEELPELVGDATGYSVLHVAAPTGAAPFAR
ncbi:MAG: DUF4865 family protein [Pseudomonadota bacterium]